MPRGGVFTLGQHYPCLGAWKRRAALLYSDNSDKECRFLTPEPLSDGLRIDSSHPCIQPWAPDDNGPVATTSTDSPDHSRGETRDYGASGARSQQGGVGLTSLV